jgi:hypothetical protein
MASNNSLNVVGLDFNQTKSSLVAYLSSQETLKDYNFDGSILSTILDVLAYNTHYQAFYANMVANEMFLDSAVMRPSVVSHAKTIGYTPQSNRASTAVIDITPTTSNTDSFLRRGAEFTGVDSEGTSYRFVLTDTVYTNEDGIFKNIEIKEGTLRRMTYVYDATKRSTSILIIPNNKIDTTTIRVNVRASAVETTGSLDVWSLAGSFIDLTSTSKVFFLQERETGVYELYFGDNFIGVQPTVGSIVTVEYLETNGDIANGITEFTTSIGGLLSPVLVSQSSGGSSEESIDRIKFVAPKFFQAGGRSVTVNDYTAAVFREYPNADSVLVYGGETVVPPQYGKVFIAVKPKSGSSLTQSEKYSLSSSLRRNSSIVTIIPEIVDADYIDIIVSSIVTYKPELLSFGVGTLKALVVAQLFTYSATTLESFGDNFYLSKVSENINNLDTAITSNQTKIYLRKTTDLNNLTEYKGFTIDFKNPITQSASDNITSSPMIHASSTGTVFSSVRITDDGFGKLNLVRTDPLTQITTTIYSGIGEIYYSTGIIKFNGKFAPISIGNSQRFLTVTVTPLNTDIFSFENKILRISRVHTDSVSISMVPYEIRKQFTA